MRSNLQINHPAQERLATSTGSTSSTQFPNSGVGFLLDPTCHDSAHVRAVTVADCL